MQQGADLTGTIEVLAPLAERAGVTLDHCSARVCGYSSDAVTVAGEILPIQGATLPSDVEVVATVYDDRGRVIGTASQNFDSDDYYGFDTFFFEYVSVSGSAAKVRIHARPS